MATRHRNASSATAAKIAELASLLRPDAPESITDALHDALEGLMQDTFEGFDFSDVQEITDAIDARVEKAVESGIEEAMDNASIPDDFDVFVKYEDAESFIRDNDLVTSSDISDFIVAENLDEALNNLEDVDLTMLHDLVNVADPRLTLVDELKQTGWRGLVRRVKFVLLGR